MTNHSFVKPCLITLLSVAIGTIFCAATAQSAQSPLYPFPQQAPAVVSAQPFLQSGQIVVGKASVTHVAPAQRSYVSPTLISSNTLGSNTATSSLLPAPFARSYAAPVVPPLQIVLSEHEMLNINPRTELAYQGRIERHVQSSRDINSFAGMMIQSLGRHGWSTSWQGIRNPSGTLLTDLYQSGGQHLRLEVGQSNSNTGGYQVVLYTF